MTDYSNLIDAETWAFIEKTNAHYPPDAVDLDIAGQRAVYDRMCAAFHVPHPANVRHADETDIRSVAPGIAAVPANGGGQPETQPGGLTAEIAFL
jgi:hypothetical protein